MSTRNLMAELTDRPMLCDGGMGTQLIAAGLPVGACGVLWNVDNPDAIVAVHTRYREAGCDLVTTNTFQASRTALTMHSLSDRTAELNAAGATVARRAAGDDGFVLADIGPFGGFLEPLGDTTEDEARGIFTEQLAAMREAGADAAVVETMSDASELAVAVRAAKDVDDWPVIATYAFERADGKTFRTMMGVTVADAVRAAIDAGADVVGANCGTSLGLPAYEELARELVAAAGDVPVILQPNAGSPRTVDGKSVYDCGPDEMAALVPKLLAAGVRVIGGCCGTTPAHLAAMGRALR